MDTIINNLIKRVHWQVAKTMPEIPHEYIVIDDYKDKQGEFKIFIDKINHDGYAEKFFNKEYKYLDIDGYKYWVIENIINRAKIEAK